MIETYTNEVGKSRPIDADSSEQSTIRKKWFSDFETKLRSSFPDLMQNVQLRIVGSVSKDLASRTSDIDIVIQSKSSDRLLAPKVRSAIFKLLDEMRNSGEKTFDIEVQETGNPLMFSAVADFRRQK